MEEKKSVFGTRYTYPGRKNNWKNILLDKKNQKSFIQRFYISTAKEELKNNKITEADYALLKKEIFGK